ncbi:DDE-type integrase/transposase/recombinase [Phormidium sp. CLA17]|nr:DDE-type integrase/transposase/recombinase [Leptolyngbya sp. Cla-17]
MVESYGLEEVQPPAKERLILEELIEDAEQKEKILLRYRAVAEISQAPDTLKKEKIKLWADRLGVHERTVTRLCEKVGNEGVAALARLTRADAGMTKGSKLWRGKTLEEWKKFIEDKYETGNKCGRSMSRNQVFIQVKGHATLELGLKEEGEYPSRGFVYTVLNPLVQPNKKGRNPGQGPGIVMRVLDAQKNEEEIVVERSNQVWQIDHTLLDNLLVDANGETAGTIWLTAIIDTYSSCLMGCHLSFVGPGSHEVALALRHAILQKHYGPEYELREKWEACGLPEYIVTDKGKDFLSAHLRRVGIDLGIKLRRRLYTEQGAAIERPFLGIKNEYSSKLPGYKGGSLAERPENTENYACICYEDYDRKLVRHIVDHRNTHLYPKVKNQTCQQRWWAGLVGGKPIMPSNERDLDVCLMKETDRSIQKYGCIAFECLIYGAGWRKDDAGLWRYDEDADFLKDHDGKVSIRYNPSNIVYILIYTKEKNGQPSKYLGTIRAKHSEERDLYRDEERLSLKEWQDRKEKRRKEGKAVDQSSIHREQLDLTQFSNEQVSAHRKRKRKAKEVRGDEQARITRASNHSNVVELPVPNASRKSKKPSKTATNAGLTDTAIVESINEQSEIQVKPALYVVPDWNEFVEDGW